MGSVRNDIRVDDDGLPCADLHHWAEEAVQKLPSRCQVAVKSLTADSKAEVRMGERLAASVGLSGPRTPFLDTFQFADYSPGIVAPPARL